MTKSTHLESSSQSLAIKQFIQGAAICIFLVPVLFYLEFEELNGYSWALTLFFVFINLFAAIGTFFSDKTDFHTKVEMRGDWIDKIGAFWLLSCVLGPLIGWIITNVFLITEDSWQFLYVLRLFIAAGLPLITAFALIRYIRGKSALVSLPILIVVTMLPIWSVVDVSRDLQEGLFSQTDTTDGKSILFLKHTQRSVSSKE